MPVFGLSVRYYVGGAEDPLALQELSIAFERGAAELADVGKHLFPRLIPVLEKAVDAQFDAQGDGPNSGKWAPLSPAYLKRLRSAGYAQVDAMRAAARGLKAAGLGRASGARNRAANALLVRLDSGGFRILERTGRLRAALTKSFSGGAMRHYTGTELRFGTAGVPYASFHQTGTERGLPRRPPFDFRSETAEEMKAATKAGAREAIRAARIDRFASGPLAQEGGTP